MISEFRAVTFPTLLIVLVIVFFVIAMSGFCMLLFSSCVIVDPRTNRTNAIIGAAIAVIFMAAAIVSAVFLPKNRNAHKEYTEDNYHIDYMMADMKVPPEKVESVFVEQRTLVHYQCNQYEYWYLKCPKTKINPVVEPAPTYEHVLKKDPEDYRITNYS
jgi:hypothetical protein